MRSAIELVRKSVMAFAEAQGPRLAAALSYYTIFSLAPLLIIIVAVLGIFFGQAEARLELMTVLNEQAGPGIASFVEGLISATAQENSRLATIIGIAILIFASTNLFTAMQGALNAIWKVEPRRDNGFIRIVLARLLALGLVAVLAVIGVLALAAQTVLGWASDTLTAIVPGISFLVGVGGELLILTVIAAAIMAVHKILVHRLVGWRPLLVGALATAILFRIGQTLIALYLTTSAVGSAFGAAGSLVALLLFVYYSMQIFLLGTAFTREYSLALDEDAATGDGPKEEAAAQAT